MGIGMGVRGEEGETKRETQRYKTLTGHFLSDT